MEPFEDPAVDTSNSHEALKKIRPSWDEYFMRIAHEVATRSTCPRLAVGAVIVRDKRILTTGYNGSPSGMPHCDDVGCLIRIVDGRESCQRTLHAEQNAIIQAAYHGVSITGASIYCTHQPCLMCVKMIMNAGVEEVHYAGGYPDPLAMELAAEGGLAMVRFTTTCNDAASPETQAVRELPQRTALPYNVLTQIPSSVAKTAMLSSSEGRRSGCPKTSRR